MKLNHFCSVFGLWLFLTTPAFSQDQVDQDNESTQTIDISVPAATSGDTPEPSADINPTETGVSPQPTVDGGGVSPPDVASNVTLTEAQQASLRADCSVLQRIYSTLNGTNWIKKDGWESQDLSSCCSWYGVSCNNGGRVKGIRLPANGIYGSIPAEIGQLSGLLSLDLSKNHLSNQIPDSFGSLTALISLNLDGNGLGGPISESLGGMIALQSLHLRNNSFSSLPESLSRLVSLRGLFLTNNQFAGAIPPVIFKMINLEILALDFNQLQGNIPDDIGSMVKLQSLYLKRNMLSGPLPEGLAKCADLRTISLSHNKIQGSIPTSYTNLTNLITLDISRNGLIGPIPSNIGNLKNLERLSLSQNQLVGPIPSSLRELEKLQRLAIHLNALNGIFPDLPSPRNLTFCRVQPNPFNGCPSNDRVRDRTTLAFQCQLDCSPKSINAVTAAGSVMPFKHLYIGMFSALLLFSFA